MKMSDQHNPVEGRRLKEEEVQKSFDAADDAIINLCHHAASLVRGLKYISSSEDDIPKFMPKGTPKKVLRMIGEEGVRVHGIGASLADNYRTLRKSTVALYQYALTLESRVEKLEGELENKRWQQAAKESREKYPRSKP